MGRFGVRPETTLQAPFLRESVLRSFCRFFGLSLNQRTVQLLTQFVDGKFGFEYAVDCKRDLPGFLTGDDDHGVGLLSQAESRPVAQAIIQR